MSGGRARRRAARLEAAEALGLNTENQGSSLDELLRLNAATLSPQPTEATARPGINERVFVGRVVRGAAFTSFQEGVAHKLSSELQLDYTPSPYSLCLAYLTAEEIGRYIDPACTIADLEERLVRSYEEGSVNRASAQARAEQRYSRDDDRPQLRRSEDGSGFTLWQPVVLRNIVKEGAAVRGVLAPDVQWPIKPRIYLGHILTPPLELLAPAREAIGQITLPREFSLGTLGVHQVTEMQHG